MEGHGTSVTPVLPDHGVLAEGGITTAGNISQDTIKLEGHRLSILVGSKLHGGHHGGVVVGDHETRALEAFRLMNQHMTALVVGIVGHDESSFIIVAS